LALVTIPYCNVVLERCIGTLYWNVVLERYIATLLAAVTVCKSAAGVPKIPYSSLLGRRFTMKRSLILPVSLLGMAAALAGCAVPGPYYAAQPVDPYAWRTVSVTPVAPGTVARSGSNVTYTTEPAPAVTYVQQPVYVEQPVYAPAPIYGAPVYGAPAYWYPPVSIGLDFVFSNRGGRGWGNGGYGRGYRGRR
jgi:hypothetical protein